MQHAYNRAQDNVVEWETYEETQEDMQVYEIKQKKKSVNLLSAGLNVGPLDAIDHISIQSSGGRRQAEETKQR